MISSYTIASILESTLDGHIDEPRQRTVERGHLVLRWPAGDGNSVQRISVDDTTHA